MGMEGETLKIVMIPLKQGWLESDLVIGGSREERTAIYGFSGQVDRITGEYHFEGSCPTEVA